VTIYDQVYNEDFTELIWKTYKIDDSYKMTDLWKNKDIEPKNGNLKARVPPHDVLLLKLSKQGQ
jgi:hypothetical protein